MPNVTGAVIAGLVEKPDASEAPSNLAFIGRYVLTPDIFETLQSLNPWSGDEIQLTDEINIHAQRGSVVTDRLNGRRSDSGSVDGFILASTYEYQKRLLD